MEELRMSNDSGGRLATAHWKLLLQGSRCDTAEAAQPGIAGCSCCAGQQLQQHSQQPACAQMYEPGCSNVQQCDLMLAGWALCGNQNRSALS
jgi:hypothetical protein